MIRNLLTLFLSLYISLYGFSQERFHVLHVRGNINIDTAKTYIRVGDEFKGNPNFRFSSENDISILLSNLRGKLVLSPLREGKHSRGEFFYFLNENLLPLKDYTGTRGKFDQFTYLFFNGGELLVPKKIRISKKPSSKDSYYYLKLTSSEDEKLERRLSIDPKGYIDINNFIIGLPANTKQSVKSCEINYYDGINGESITIKTIQFIPKQITEIKKEIHFYREYLRKEGKNEKEILNLISGHLENIYGDEVFSIL